MPKTLFILVRDDGFYQIFDFTKEDKHLAKEEAEEHRDKTLAEGIACVLVEGAIVER